MLNIPWPLWMLNMPTLREELAADSQSIGYAPFIAAGDDAAVAYLINRRSGAGSASVYRNDLAIPEIVRAIVATDFANLTALQISKLQLLGGTIDATNTNMQTIFLGIFTGMTGTINALAAIAARAGSRAEVLWGTGTIITADQVRQSR